MEMLIREIASTRLCNLSVGYRPPLCLLTKSMFAYEIGRKRTTWNHPKTAAVRLVSARSVGLHLLQDTYQA